MENDILKLISYYKTFNSELMELNIKYGEEIESLNRIIDELKDKVLSIETERDVLKSTLSDTKADIKYLLEYGEGNGYIRNKYIRGEKNE